MSNRREFVVIYRSGWEDDPDTPSATTVRARNIQEAADRSLMTDVIRVAVVDAEEMDVLERWIQEDGDV